MNKEAKARITINRMLEEAGWRFFDNEQGEANIQLESIAKITNNVLDNMGENFEKISNGFVDYLLLDDKQRPFIVLEAKKEEIHPLSAKEQARKYALSKRAKYIILSNGNIHYFWNLEKGNPEMITSFPSYESLINSKALTTKPENINNLKIDKYWVALSQEPSLETTSIWKSEDDTTIFNYCLEKGLRVLRPYQLQAIAAVKASILNNQTRFLLEMATGTGKTLTSSGIIKMFIRSDLANRVLFLVDRIELENQARKDLTKYLAKDGIQVAVYKESKNDWKSADIVISTIQSFTSEDKYKRIFKPTDFDLIISDEAHRSLGASNLAVFEYFIGYKLGLTATPKNYLKGVEFEATDPRELERRHLLDTYNIFGCESGNPTFSYTLNDGVRDKILINPTIVDARTDITTELLSEKGLIINVDDNDDIEVEINNQDGSRVKVLNEKGYEKTFFSDATNQVLCQTFMVNALTDPITGEIGKSIIFCVNIEHARKITEILNIIADKMYPNKYNSDFAVQITSNIMDAQQMTINFANNNLNGITRFVDDYSSSKSRVAVTVGMMTTGYDCPDILNLGIFRPIFSPSEFIQIKGRGTRLNTFKLDDIKADKTTFKLFDFFAVCEYFEEKFKYDEKIAVPRITGNQKPIDGILEETIIDKVINKGTDELKTLDIEEVSETGMKIDKMLYKNFELKVKDDPNVQDIIRNRDIEALEWYLKQNVFDKPMEYFNVQKLERSLGLDRKLTVREIALNILGLIDRYKTKNEKIKDEFDNFKLLNKEELDIIADKIRDVEELFGAYILDEDIRKAVRTREYTKLFATDLKTNLRSVKDIKIRNKTVLDYIANYISENNINCENFK